jgi:hypothetical protein
LDLNPVVLHSHVLNSGVIPCGRAEEPLRFGQIILFYIINSLAGSIIYIEISLVEQFSCNLLESMKKEDWHMFHICASLYLKGGGVRTFIKLEGTETEGDTHIILHGTPFVQARRNLVCRMCTNDLRS